MARERDTVRQTMTALRLVMRVVRFDPTADIPKPGRDDGDMKLNFKAGPSTISNITKIKKY